MIMFWMLVLTAIIALLIFGIIKALDNDRAAEVIVFLVFATMFVSMVLGIVVHMYTMVSYYDYRKGNYKGVIKITTDEKGNIKEKDTVYTKELKWW